MAKIDGLNKLTARLENFKDNAVKDITGILAQGGEKIEERAKKYAPVNDGLLRNSIIADQESAFKTQISVGVFYAPYIEFGTKRRFNANGRQEIATQFKGKAGRGDYFDFLNNILDWVKKKGIGSTYSTKTRKKNRMRKDEFLQIAQSIANRIIRNGIHPQPFFFRAYDETLPGILRLLRKYKK